MRRLIRTAVSKLRAGELRLSKTTGGGPIVDAARMCVGSSLWLFFLFSLSSWSCFAPAIACAQQGLAGITGPTPVLDPGGNRLVWQPTSDQGGYLDLDRLPPTAEYVGGPNATPWLNAPPGYAEPWSWQLMPSSLIYKAYLAGLKESRLASQHTYIKDQGWSWDAVLGARVGLLRYGNQDPIRPDGFQLDIEGSAQPRLDVPDDVNLQAADFRAGLPLTWGNGPFRTKVAYYHLSSHVGDEFLLANPGFNRLNYSRDCLVVGETYFITDELRIYGEVAWAFQSDVCEPWEFQFGADYAPVRPTGYSGAPFFAVNGHLRQEVDFGGTFVLESGWAWLSDQNSRLLRLGLQYYNGYSPQFSFYHRSEQALGVGLWYDF